MAKNSLVSPQKGFTVEQLRLIIKILLSVLVVFSIVLLVWKWRERLQFRKEQQQRRLRELELTAIRSQMNPHFLFNCLNSVQNLIQQNRSHEANQYLADFAGLIRKVLKNSEKEEISLAEELETVKQYLSLEKLRFDFNFEITVDQGIDQQNTMIPSMLLQPFVENAIIHGLQHKTGDRELKINIVHVNNGLKISIEDNGIGCEASKTFATGKNGKGSKLMKERLDLLREKQGEKYNLEIIDINQEGLTGTRVEIFIPEEK
jgi:LytS/YehU family sensor histidine kinase